MKSLKFIESMLGALIKQFQRENLMGNEDSQKGIVEGLEMAMRLVKDEIEKIQEKK
jgi:hypothetical protein